MNIKGKKGKVHVIPLLIVGLVGLMAVTGVFLPQSEKCVLFPDSQKCIGQYGENILSESTGVLKPSDTAARYTLQNAQLFRRESLDNIKLFEEAASRNSWFSSSSAKTTFEVQKESKDAKLFIVLTSATGGLKVKLNGRIIDRLYGVGVHVVPLPLSKLKDKNTLELKSSNPWLPFISNKHIIGSAVLRQEYTITQNRVNQKVEIKQNPKEINRAILKFDTECLSDENLTLIVNSKRVIEEKFCVGFEGDILKYLDQKGGENEITLSSEGNYLIRNIRLDIGVKQQSWPAYYFNVPSDKIGSLTYLKLTFGGDPGAERKLTIYLNGNEKVLSVDTKKKDWKTVVTGLKEGQNSLMVIPETEVILEKIELD